MDESVVPKRSSRVFSRRSADGIITMVHLDVMEHYFNADGITGEVWSLIDGKRSVGKITRQIAKKHGADPEKCLKNIVKILRDLAKAKLLQLP